MATFIGQLIGFGFIVLILMKFAVPPIRKLMAERKAAVRQQLEESAKAAQRLADADRHHAELLAKGRAEAQVIVEEASSDSVRIAEQFQAQARAEFARIKQYGEQQTVLLRAQAIRELRARLGDDAVRRAADIVRGEVSDPRERAATVDRFLDELEAMAPASLVTEVDDSDLRPASRDARAALVASFDALAPSMSPADLSRLAAELVSVDALLKREPILARHLAESGGTKDAKRAMLEQLLGNKVGADTLQILIGAATARWSSVDDLIDGLEYIARISLLESAKRAGQISAVVEQLFWFGRTLDAYPRLAALLNDGNTPAAKRIALLRSVLEGPAGANETVIVLLSQTLELQDGVRLDDSIQVRGRLAVARQGELVAQAVAAAELTDSQQQRLTAVLSRIYRNPVAVHVTVDPQVLGGLSVAIGDEVIDGTLSARLTAAATKLPD